MRKRNLIWAGAILLVAAAAIFLPRRPAAAPVAGQQDPQLRPLAETYRLIRENGYRPNDDSRLLQGAAGGMAGAADEYSAYIPPAKADSFRRRIEGRDCGVGLKLETSQGVLKVFQAVYDSPAYRAGLKAGQAIVAIEGKDTDQITLPEAEQLINEGPPGSPVTLAVAGPSGKVRTVKLQRREFKVESVVGFFRGADNRWEYLVSRQPPIALLRIREFVRETAEDVQVALRQVDVLDGLVLDLRDNPGGQLPSAVAVADLFLAEGPIVTLVDRSGKGRPQLARSEGTYGGDLRMAVLVNGGTASAAEIVSGALALNGRAVLVGSRTRGKGQIQSVLPLPADMGEVDLTTAEFLLGDGVYITHRRGSDRWGLDPDVRVSVPVLERIRLRRLWSQADAPQPAASAPITRPAGELPHTRSATLPTTSAEPSLPATLLAEDAQLSAAIELLTSEDRYNSLLAQRAAETKPATRPSTAP